MKGELKHVEEVSQERSLIAGNLRNELLTAQDQLKALDAQMTKDREKVLKLREDKRILLDKVIDLSFFGTEIKSACAEKNKFVYMNNIDIIYIESRISRFPRITVYII